MRTSTSATRTATWSGALQSGRWRSTRIPSTTREGLTTNYGSPSALWVREVLQTGWADTYFQGIQSFDIHNRSERLVLRQAEVNPFGALHEVTRANNVESRLVTSADGAGTGRCLQHRGTARGLTARDQSPSSPG
jgi:hypothetical protein